MEENTPTPAANNDAAGAPEATSAIEDLTLGQAGDAATAAVETAAVPTTAKREINYIHGEAAKKYGWWWGTGRRKASVARVRIIPGEGKFEINKREVNKYFALEKDRRAVRVPLEVTDSLKSMDVFVNVHGGGTTGQAGAVVLGLA